MHGIDEFIEAVNAAYVDTIDIDRCSPEVRAKVTRRVGFLIGEMTQLSWELRNNPERWF